MSLTEGTNNKISLAVFSRFSLPHREGRDVLSYEDAENPISLGTYSQTGRHQSDDAEGPNTLVINIFRSVLRQ